MLLLLSCGTQVTESLQSTSSSEPDVGISLEASIDATSSHTISGTCFPDGATVTISSDDMNPSSVQVICSNGVYSSSSVTFDGLGPNDLEPIITATLSSGSLSHSATAVTSLLFPSISSCSSTQRFILFDLAGNVLDITEPSADVLQYNGTAVLNSEATYTSTLTIKNKCGVHILNEGESYDFSTCGYDILTPGSESYQYVITLRVENFVGAFAELVFNSFGNSGNLLKDNNVSYYQATLSSAPSTFDYDIEISTDITVDDQFDSAIFSIDGVETVIPGTMTTYNHPTISDTISTLGPHTIELNTVWDFGPTEIAFPELTAQWGDTSFSHRLIFECM